MPRAWNPAVPSDGMTVDTPRGPVDRVALDRARSWWPTRLTMAEKGELDRDLTGSREQAVRIATGLGCSPESVLQRVARMRRASAGARLSE